MLFRSNMAYGSIFTDIVQSSTAGTPPQFNDGNGTQTGTLCRAWVNFNGTSGASPVVRASFNVSSVTRSATGTYAVVFSTALSDANYSVTTAAGGSSSNSSYLCIKDATSLSTTGASFGSNTTNGVSATDQT